MAISTIVNSTLGDICIRIPQHYHRQPVLSRLISRYALTVNIAAALLETDTRKDGWFNLEIQGSYQQVEAGISYIQGLNIEIHQLNLKSLEEDRKTLNSLCLSSYCAGFHANTKMQTDEEDLDWNVVQRQTNRAKFHVCIPKNYRYSPVIAGLISCCGLTVNIVGASLNTNTKDEGWFDLEIWGNSQQIVLGLRYLKQLGLQIWL
ncbi:NIL domain-containing protein [Nostoc sp. UHCC 0302]|uniref:NIL domain-containing protein n=1 Tax=Nostoc sp. UHCC 0302 TaxID=3134896 RepID=UPI00311C9EF8